MMLALAFERAATPYGGKRMRRACFERRSGLPVAAACLVANAARETLAAAFGGDVNVRLCEPVIPDGDAWNAILRDAYLYRIRGARGEGVLVIRAADALALSAALFGETTAAARVLSPIEEEVLSRLSRRLAGAFAPVCGQLDPGAVERIAGRPVLTTYFELIVGGPVAATLGIALAREPRIPGGPTLRPEDLLEVELDVDVEFAVGEIEAAALLLLQPNTQVRMMTKVGAPAALKVAGRTVARGECGILGERNAFVVRDGPGGGKR